MQLVGCQSASSLLGPSQTRFYGDGRKEWGFTRDWEELIKVSAAFISLVASSERGDNEQRTVSTSCHVLASRL